MPQLFIVDHGAHVEYGAYEYSDPVIWQIGKQSAYFILNGAREVCINSEWFIPGNRIEVDKRFIVIYENNEPVMNLMLYEGRPRNTFLDGLSWQMQGACRI